MRRLKNSAKVIIGSVIAVLCVAAIVLGCIFGIKKPNPNNPNVDDALAADYAQLAADINAANKPVDYEIYDDVPYEGICDYKNLIELTPNYFIYEDLSTGKKNAYFYKKTNDEANPYTYVNLTAKESEGGFVKDEAISYRLESRNENYFIISSTISEENSIIYYSLIYLGSNVPVEVFNYETSMDNMLIESICLFDNYFLIESIDITYHNDNYSVINGTLNIFALKLEKEKFDLESLVLYKHSIEEYSSEQNDFNIIFSGDVVGLFNGNSLTIISYKNNILNVFSKEFEIDSNFDVSYKFKELSVSKIFVIEEKIYLDSNYKNTSIFDGEDYIDYKYYIFDLKNNTLSDYSLESEYYYAECNLISSSAKTYSITQQKINNNELISSYVTKYYNENDNEILSYNFSNKIEKLQSRYAILSSGIYKIENKTLAAFMDFSNIVNYENFEIESLDSNSAYFVFGANGYQGIMDFLGNIVVDVTYNAENNNNLFEKIYPIQNDYTLGRVSGDKNRYFLIDCKTKNTIEIENFVENENLDKLLLNGLNLYLKYESVNEQEFLNLYDANQLIIENVKDIKFTENLNKDVVIEITSETKNYYILYKIDGRMNFVNETIEILSYSNLNIISPYKSTTEGYVYIKGTSTAVGKITLSQGGGHGAFWCYHDDYLYVDMYMGYYIKECKIELNWASDGHYVTIKSSMGTDHKIKNNNSTYENIGCDGVTYTYSFNSDGTVHYEIFMDECFYPSGQDFEIVGTAFYGEIGKFPYEISFHVNNNYNENATTRSTAPSAMIYYYNTEANITTTATRTGYSFAGWYLTAECNDNDKVEHVNKSDSKVKNTNKTLYAKWIPIIYSIKLELDGGSISGSTTLSAIFDREFQVEIPSKVGYTFKGWKATGMSYCYNYYNWEYYRTGYSYIYKSGSDYQHFYGTTSANSGFRGDVYSGGPNSKYDYGITKDFSRYENGTWVSNGSQIKYFKNLHTTNSETVTLTAQWEVNNYNIEFRFTNNGLYGLKEHSEMSFELNNNSDYSCGPFEDGFKVTLNNNNSLVSTPTSGNTARKITVEGAFIYPGNANYSIYNLVKTTILTNSINQAAYYALYQDDSGAFSKLKIDGGKTYQLAGWYYYNTLTGKYHNVLETGNSYGTIKAALGDALNAGASSGQTITFYAYYKERDYFVDFQWDGVDGSSSTTSKTENDVNNKLISEDKAINIFKNNNNNTSLNPVGDMYYNSYYVTCEALTNSNTSLNNTAKTGVIQSGNNTFKNASTTTGSMKNISMANSARMTVQVAYPYYIINKIELLQFPYRYGESDYRRATVAIELNWNGSSATYTVKRDTTTISTYGSDSNGSYYQVDSYSSSDKTINRIYVSTEISSAGVCSVVVTVRNLYYASLKSSTSDLMTSSSISKESVDSTGTYGFTFKPYAISNYMTPDSVSGQFSSGTQNRTSSGATEYYVVPIESKTIWLNRESYEIENNVDGFYYRSSSNGTRKFISTSSTTLSTGSNMRIYCHFIDKDKGDGYAYYKYNSSFSKVNYGNSQVIAINPEQAKMNASENSNHFTQVGYYELSNYLRTITFTVGTNNYNLYFTQPTRSIYNYSYNSLDINVDSNTTVSATKMLNGTDSGQLDQFGQTINYFGTTYTKICGFTLTVNEKAYRLYLTRNISNNHVMYFLIADGELTHLSNNSTNCSISFGFSSFNNKIDITSAATNDRYDGTTGLGGFTLSNLKPNSSSSNVTSNLGNGGTYTVNNFAPKDSIIYAFTPKAGYLINNITVSIGDQVLYNFTLNRSEIGGRYFSNTFLLYNDTGTLINYGASNNHYFKSFGFTDDNALWGIYYTNILGENDTNSWIVNTGVPANFETFYLLISGIYNNVTINVSTVTYFEFQIDDDSNLIGLNNVSTSLNRDITNSLNQVTNWNSCKLTIANKTYASSAWNKFSPSSTSNKLYLKEYIEGDNRFYRLIFFGCAQDFRYGLAMYASGTDYSYYFNAFRLYAQSSTTTAVSGALGARISLSSDSNKLIYMETASANGIPNLFNINSYSSNRYIRTNKYTLMMNANKNPIKINSNAYLSNGQSAPESGTNYNVYPISTATSGGTFGKSITTNAISTTSYRDGKRIKKGTTIYQLDDPSSKTNSWFNNTTLNNIDYYRNGNTSNSTNWQNSPSGLQLSNCNGYGFSFRYYEIPGYYLQYIDIYIPKIERWITLEVSKFISNSNYFVIYTNYNSKISSYFTYKIKYNANGYFDIFFYNNSSNTVNDQINALGVLTGDIKINFYSQAMSIDINYIHNSAAASTSDLRTTGSTTQNITYDTMATLNTTMRLDGYTFIGWGSQKYFDSLNNTFVDRFVSQGTDKSVPNTWSSYSSFIDMSNYFAFGNRDKLLGLKKLTTAETFIYDWNIYSSDFYVSHGWFMTDTGNAASKSSNGGQNENYNFWSMYGKLFTQSIGNYSGRNTHYNIKLYGIWKANTYNVILNLNDSNVELLDKSGNKNGSTVSSFKVANGSFDEYGYGNNGIVYPGKLSKVTESGTTRKLFLYVTYDTNDWYVVVNTDNNIYSNKNSSKTNEILSLKQYIIDRYGYTWLGWFNEQLLNFKTTSNNKYTDRLQVVGTDAFRASAQNDAMPVLNKTNYALFKTKTDVSIDTTSNYAEFTVNSTVLGDVANNSVYNGRALSTFVYKGALGLFDYDNNSYVHFYIYNENSNKIAITSSINIWGSGRAERFYAYDYLNTYNAASYDGRCFTYYDTAINYVSYRDTQNGTNKWVKDVSQIKYDGSNGQFINSYRSITIYAYWETNYYTVVVDYRDTSSNPNSLTGIGSTAVTIGDYLFDNVYFDDPTLESRLNKFIPIRLGYDFIGWSFNPLIENKGADYEFIKSNNYILNDTLKAYLYTKVTDRYGLQRLDSEVLGDSEQDHSIYLFAGWTAQTYSINVSLNISNEDLLNLYRADSEFAISLYNTVKGNEAFKDYTGIKQSFAMEDPSSFTDIVANVSFIITFDQKFETAEFVINQGNNQDAKRFKLDQLFATSAGYYLLGWLYNPTDVNSYMVSNNLMSEFGTAAYGQSGNLINKLETGGSLILDKLFDQEFYNKLYVQTYLDGAMQGVYKPLSSVDFDSQMSLRDTRIENGKSYFGTFTHSSNQSTNFGYVTVSGRDYYLAVEKDGGNYYMYYYNSNGLKQYITPYVGSDIANAANSSLTFDETYFYWSNYVIYFDNTYASTGNNAFYTTGDYYWSDADEEEKDLHRIRIMFVNKNSKDDMAVEGKNPLQNITLAKTREFTLFAHWSQKVDLSTSITNGNNNEGRLDSEVKGTGASNLGHAGLYTIENSNVDNLASVGTAVNNNIGYKEISTTSERDTIIKIDAFNFYDDVKFDIMPYFNGRFISEIKITFYSYEDLKTTYSSGIEANYQKVTYVLTLRFKWDNNARRPVLETADDRLSNLTRNGEIVQGIGFSINSSGVLVITGTDKLSNLDINAFNSSSKNQGFLTISGYTNSKGRLDVNPININMQNVKSNVEIVCEFSIQTFNAEFYNIYDNNGFNLSSTGGTNTSEYTAGSFGSLDALYSAIDSGWFSGKQTYGNPLSGNDIINATKPNAMATIPVNSAENSTTFNAPYGFFIYGNHQLDIPIETEISKDVYYGQEEFGGYEYIYANGYYNFGNSSTSVINSIYYQCSPVLGAPGLYGESVRKTSTLYTFYSWFEAKEEGLGENKTLILTEYSQADERTYLNRNVYLFGYYYANNRPTNIQFYTWEDEYVEYTENIDEYTLQSTTTNSPYSKGADTTITPKEAAKDFIDESGRVIVMFNKSYGIDGVGFSADNYSSLYIQDDQLKNNFNFVNNTLIRTYWYYRYLNYYLYFTNEDDNVKRYIRYDSSTGKYYYLDNEDDLSSKRNYIKLYTPSDLADTSFVVYADFDPDNSGIVINNESDLANSISRLTRLNVDDSQYIYKMSGSNMYVRYTDKYYEIKKIEDYETDEELTDEEKTEISMLIPNSAGTNISAKFYVKLAGKIYYLIVSNGRDGSTTYNASILYEYNGNFFSASSSMSNQYTITTIDNYYLSIADEFYEVVYPKAKDSYGISYIDPFNSINTCNVDIVMNGVEVNMRLYFNYNEKLFYKEIVAGTYANRLTTDDIPGFRVYTPVNNNYSVLITLDNLTNKWQYDSVKINSLPSPNIGFWYDNNSYSYIGYVNMLESDIDYLVDKSINGVDENGVPTDPNKIEGKDRIYDTAIKYVNTVYSHLTQEEINSIIDEIRDYVNAYKSGKIYLKTLITVDKDGYNYKAGTNIVESINALITCEIPITVNGKVVTIRPATKYVLGLITSDTSINENIYAIPIYSRNVIEFNTSAVGNVGTNVTISIPEMNVRHFETIGNNYTHMYDVRNGDYLRFALLTSSQYNEMKSSRDYPATLNDMLIRYGVQSAENLTGIPLYNEEDYISNTDGNYRWNTMNIPFSGQTDGDYYIVAYYQKSGQNYIVRVSDNSVRVNLSGGTVTISVV